MKTEVIVRGEFCWVKRPVVKCLMNPPEDWKLMVGVDFKNSKVFLPVGEYGHEMEGFMVAMIEDVEWCFQNKHPYVLSSWIYEKKPRLKDRLVEIADCCLKVAGIALEMDRFSGIKDMAAKAGNN